MSGINSGVERFFVMKIVRFFGAALAVTMLGGAAVAAQAAPVAAWLAVTASQLPSTSPDQVLALSASQRAQPAAAPQPAEEPKKLPLADFGQWDEAASEN
ncbi:MAG TPA: hypothetical protein VHX12_13490 [Acidisoma sp.]|jgi:hypothetical protein|nr:hypothetical protein [Acidisoma sp.]